MSKKPVRFATEESDEAISIVIRARMSGRDIVLLILSVVLSPPLVLIFFVALARASRPQGDFSSLFAVLWFSMLAISFGRAVYIFLWQVYGKEIIEVRDNVLVVKRQIWGFASSKVYRSENIQSMRIARRVPLSMINVSWGLAILTRWDAPIAFDYEKEIIRIGRGLPHEDAKQVVALLNKYLHGTSA